MPSITQALAGGFNLVAEHIYLIVLPILFDLMLWLGPRLSVYNLLKDNVTRLFQELLGSAPITLVPQVRLMQESMNAILAQTNVMGTFTLFPISIPLLFGMTMPDTINKAGDGTRSILPGIQTIDINSGVVLVLIVIALSLTGLLFGAFYYAIIAREASTQKYHLTSQRFFRQTINLVLMLILFLVLLLILFIPISCILSFFMILSPSLSQILLFIAMLSVAWMIVPIFFTFHGVFFNGTVQGSFKVSVNLAKWFSAPTSFFIVAIVIISQGLNLIWTIPAYDSWFLLIGIFGHAFITTSLVCASFVLYQNYLNWIIENEDLITKGIIRNDKQR